MSGCVWLAAIWAGLIGVAVGLWLKLPAIYFMPVFLVMLVGVVFWRPSKSSCLRKWVLAMWRREVEDD